MTDRNSQRDQNSAERRLDVRRVFHEDGSSEVLLQEMSFSEGIGWFAQKTIRLDSEQVDALLRQLCCQRTSDCPTNRSRAADTGPRATGPRATGPQAPQMPEIIQLHDHKLF